MIDMKHLLINMIWLLMLSLLLACSGQNGRVNSDLTDSGKIMQDSSAQAVITFDKLEHDFGTIIEGEKVVCYFDFENTGKTDLMIQSVDATCGCTIPDWSSEPVEPGGSKSMKIIFDARGRSGTQRKVVTVISNASNEVVKLTLKAYIET
jgi:hypothetical protein